MTCPEYTPDLPQKATGSGDRVAGILEIEPQIVPEYIFDPELFEELRELLGSACARAARAALEDLSSSLQAIFSDLSTNFIDRDQVFQHAHFQGARAGMMGFTALRDALLALQEACDSEAPIGEPYERACEAALATRNAIAFLQQQPL